MCQTLSKRRADDLYIFYHKLYSTQHAELKTYRILHARRSNSILQNLLALISIAFPYLTLTVTWPFITTCEITTLTKSVWLCRALTVLAVARQHEYKRQEMFL